MTSENISFPEALQGVQAPPSTSCATPFNMAPAYPTINPTPGLPRPPFTSFPNATHCHHPVPSFSADLYDASGASFMHDFQDQGAVSFPENPSSSSNLLSLPSLSPEMYGAGGTSFVPTYQGRGAVSVSENLAPNSNLLIPPSLSSEMYSAGDASFMPTHQGQGAVYAPKIPTPNPIISTQPSFSPDMYGAGSTSFVPTYRGQGIVSVTKNFIQNSNLPPPSFSSEMYNVGGASFASNHQVQGIISPPASSAPPMSSVNNVCLQGSPYPLAGMLPNATTTAFPSSGDNGQNIQASPDPFQWSLPIQPQATVSQQHAQYQVPQDCVAEIKPRLEQGSVYREDRQTTVTFNAAPSASEMCPLLFENQPGFQLPVKNTTSKNHREGQTCTQNEVGLIVCYTTTSFNTPTTARSRRASLRTTQQLPPHTNKEEARYEARRRIRVQNMRDP